MTYLEYKDLVDKMYNYAKSYYVENETLIPDQEYDKLYKQLEEFEKQNPDKIIDKSPTQYIGFVKDGNVKHITKMYSLKNGYNLEDIKSFINKTDSDDYCIELKYDGASLNIIYKNGKLLRAITRGNGVEGMDVTHNALVIDTIPKTINYEGIIEIRGEVIILKSDFEKLNTEGIYKNPRNLASGSLRLLDSNITKDRELVFYPYGIGYGIENFNSFKDINEFFKINKFNNIWYKVSKDIDEILKTCEEYDKTHEKLNIPIDGLVIKVNNINKLLELGYNKKYPKGMVAYKFTQLPTETKIKDVIHQVSEKGKITPVAILDPVEIDGSKISKVTLNNYFYIKEKDLHINDIVYIIKSGGVIPKLIGVKTDNRKDIKNIETPKYCPKCNSETIFIGKYLYCKKCKENKK